MLWVMASKSFGRVEQGLVSMVQRKNAEEEVKLAKKQEESEAVRQAHKEEARLREDYIQRRLEAKVLLNISAQLEYQGRSQGHEDSPFAGMCHHIRRAWSWVLACCYEEMSVRSACTGTWFAGVLNPSQYA